MYVREAFCLLQTLMPTNISHLFCDSILDVCICVFNHTKYFFFVVKIFSYFSKLYSTRILDNVQANLLHHRAEYSSQFPSVLLFYFYILFLYLDRFSLWYNENNPNLAFTFTIYGACVVAKE